MTMEKESLSTISLGLIWAVGLQLACTIAYFAREEMKVRGLAKDLGETKKTFDKQIEATTSKIKDAEIRAQAIIEFVKEEVNKLEAKDEIILERMGRIELQILSMLSELSIKVGKIEGMLTNLHSSKN